MAAILSRPQCVKFLAIIKNYTVNNYQHLSLSSFEFLYFISNMICIFSRPHFLQWRLLLQHGHYFSGIILCMCPANERRHYNVTSSLIGRAHTPNDPFFFQNSHCRHHLAHLRGRALGRLLWNQRLNTLRPKQNGRHFADDTFKPIFLNENIRISIKISLRFVPMVPINNIPALVKIMAWCRPGNKPLSQPMMVCLLTHICVTQPQWVNREQSWYVPSQWETSLHCNNVSHLLGHI